MVPLEEIAVTVLRGYAVMRKREHSGTELHLDDVKENRSFTKRQRMILKTWFQQHENDDDGPRPTPNEKETLCAEANLTLTQLNNWFSNQRRRHWKRR